MDDRTWCANLFLLLRGAMRSKEKRDQGTYPCGSLLCHLIYVPSGQLGPIGWGSLSTEYQIKKSHEYLQNAVRLRVCCMQSSL